MTTENQLKIWVCYLCDTHPCLEVQVTTCRLSDQNFAQTQTCLWFPARRAAPLARAGAPWPHWLPCTLAQLSHSPLLSWPSRQGCRERAAATAAESFSPHLAAFVPLRGLGSRSRAGCTLDERALPAMAAAPRRHFARGSFVCHIPDT